MDKKILFEDQSRIENFKSVLESRKNDLQAFVDKYTKLDLEPLTKDLLKSLIQAPEKTIRELYKQFIPETSEIGLKVNKDQILETMDLPDISELEATAQNLRKDNELLNYFKLDGKEVSIDQQAFEYHCDTYRTYAKSEKEKNLFDDLKKLEILLNKIDQNTSFLGASRSGVDLNLNDLFIYRYNRLELLKDGFKEVANKLK